MLVSSVKVGTCSQNEIWAEPLCELPQIVRTVQKSPGRRYGILGGEALRNKRRLSSFELVHHILVLLYPEDDRHLLNCRTHVLYRDTRQARDREKWQADTMAAAIIMPAETVHCCMQRKLYEKLGQCKSVIQIKYQKCGKHFNMNLALRRAKS